MSQPKLESVESYDSSEYSDDDYETDSDYEDIQIEGWGDSAKKEPATWNSLVDETIKTKAGGVGSGNLHRRGGNYKPVSEDFILAQRLKKPIPGSSKTKKKPKKKKVPAISAAPAARAKPSRPYVPIPTKTVPRRQRAPPSNSTWSTANLSSEPFWEQKKPQVAQPLKPPPAPIPNRLIAHPSAKFTKSISQPGWASCAANTDHNQKPTTVVPTPSLSSQSSKYATPNSSVPQTNQSTPVFKPTFVAPEPSTSTASTLVEPSRPKSRVHLDKTFVHKHLLTPSPKLNQQSSHNPLVRLNINLAPGISTLIELSKDSDPVKIAEEFGPKHGLVVTQSAKEGIAKTLRKILDVFIQRSHTA